MSTIVKKHSIDNDELDADTDKQMQAFFDGFNVAKKDAISFSLIKIWTAIAEMLAPLFANFAAKKYSLERQHKHNKQTAHNKHRKYNRRNTDK